MFKTQTFARQKIFSLNRKFITRIFDVRFEYIKAAEYRGYTTSYLHPLKIQQIYRPDIHTKIHRQKH